MRHNMKLDQAELEAAYAKDITILALGKKIEEYRVGEYARIELAKAECATKQKEINELRRQRKNLSISINNAEQQLIKLRSRTAFQTAMVNHYLSRQAKRRAIIRNNFAKAALRKECSASSRQALEWYEEKLKQQPPMANT